MYIYIQVTSHLLRFITKIPRHACDTQQQPKIIIKKKITKGKEVILFSTSLLFAIQYMRARK